MSARFGPSPLFGRPFDGPGVLGAPMDPFGGNDLLIGDQGDDLVIGGPGSDILIGGAGNDVLVGHTADLLIGGDGADSFRLAVGFGVATIADFEVGEDTVHIVGGSGVISIAVADFDADARADTRLQLSDGSQLTLSGVGDLGQDSLFFV